MRLSFLCLAVAIATLPGCGLSADLLAVGAPGATQTMPAPVVPGALLDVQLAANTHGFRGQGFGFAVEFGDLALSEGQVARIQAIAAQYAAALPAAAKPGDKVPAVRDALRAEPFDEAALRTALAAMNQANADDRLPAVPAMLMEVRAVLTDDQRARLAARLQATPDQPDEPAPTPNFSGILGLDATQQANAAAFEAALKAAEPAPPAAPMAGMAGFWQTGDATGLTAVLPKAAVFPADAFVKLAASLESGKREILAAALAGSAPPPQDAPTNSIAFRVAAAQGPATPAAGDGCVRTATMERCPAPGN